MPIQIQDIHDQDDTVDCPLCMEVLEVDDINFFPCECGYQICRFCWHRIRTDENGLCPACRKAYPENPAEFKPLSEQELQKIRQEKKQKEVARRQKITDGRKHLANVRVLQKNLVFVVGLSPRLADVEILKRPEYFGKYGKILKVVLNSNTSYAGSQTPSCSAYVTYSKMEESLRAIQSVNNVHIDGRTLKASLGTTKYCSNYLKNQVCQKHDCMYLHEIGDEDASFTKEDMQMAKHQEYEQKLIQQMIQKEIQQEMKAKAIRQETNENGNGSAGSSPPTSTITSGLSVAQAVKKNTKLATDNTTNRPRRHSSSSNTAITDSVTEGDTFQTISKSTNKGSKLSSSIGDGSKSAGVKSGRRGAAKKASNVPIVNQAPRHKKQQQQAGSVDGKNIPSRAHSASPSGQSSEAWSEQSPPASIPSSTGASMESSPASTPFRDFNSDGNKSAQSGLKDITNQIGQSVAENSETSPSATMPALPIDIPTLEENNRGTPHSDSSSSIGRKSPFVKEGFSHDSIVQPNLSSMENNLENHAHALTKSKFMMLHKDSGDGDISQIVSNSLGFSPFGMSVHPASSLLNDMQSRENGMPVSQPQPRVMPPPGLSGVMPQNSSGWMNSHLPDSMPIKSANDWEAAFGFKTQSKPATSSADDDLGFDPFVECSKGFADLMEKERTQSTDPGRIPSAYQPISPFPDISQQQRPLSLQGQSNRRIPRMGFSESADILNGFSNLLSNASHGPLQHKLPFQFEQSQFMPHHRMTNSFSATTEQQQQQQQQHLLLGSGTGTKSGFMGAPSSLTPTKDKNNIQEWQNGLRALLPSVNISFTNQNQQQHAGSVDSSLGLSNLGMPAGMDTRKMSGLSHPPGISNSAINPNPLHQSPFPNKQQHGMPPGGFGMGGTRMSFMGGARPHQPQWGESSMSTPGLSSNRLMSPTGLQSLFGPGNRSESNPMPGAMPSYPPDPAIIQGGMPGFGPRRSRLYENPQNKSAILNSNSNDEQPHWMKSLQALTEPDNPIPQSQNNASASLRQIFSQRRSNTAQSWPPVPGLFPNTGYGQSSQPPPGFQVRPNLTKPTEFGMLHNLLENQS